MTTVSSEKATNLLCFTIINARYLFFLLCVRKVMVKNYEDKQRNGKFSKHSATLLPSAHTHTHTHTHIYTHIHTTSSSSSSACSSSSSNAASARCALRGGVLPSTVIHQALHFMFWCKIQPNKLQSAIS